MSRVRSLTRAYGSFFNGCADFALSPYTLSFKAISGCDDNYRGASDYGILYAGLFCAALTIIPILPILTKITLNLASAAIIMSLAVALIAFPIALLADLVDPEPTAFGFQYA